MRSRYYDSQPEETGPSSLTVSGTIPPWLAGTLIRNGPALFEAGHTKLRHWFDGYGLLHRFTLADGKVSYQSKFIDSAEYRSAKKTGRNRWITWGTPADPCQSIFRRFQSLFLSADNTSVAVARVGEHYFATSDMPTMQEFDPETLETRFPRVLAPRGTTAAHPSFDQLGGIWNLESTFGPVAKNSIFSLDASLIKRIHAAFTTKRTYYFHSFASTAAHFVSIEQPLYLSFWKLLGAPFAGRSYYECFEWDTSARNVLHIYNRVSGELTHRPTPHRFFYFHTINSYEEGGQLHIDFCGYDDSAIISDFYLDNLQSGGIKPANKARLMRLAVTLATGEGTLTDKEVNLELPQINHRTAGSPLRYAYGIHSSEQSTHLADAVIKYDYHHDTRLLWSEKGVYPGEPIFVAKPEAHAEDAGVLLIVCYEEKSQSSYLLVLDAHTMKEVARAYTPLRIPASLHGAFYKK